MTSFDDAWTAVADVQGWLTEGQAKELWLAAQACPVGGTIVEIGSFHGRSTIVLALGASEGTRVLAIDPHAGSDRGPQEIEGFAAEAADDHQRFLENLRASGADGRVQHVREFSHDALADIEGRIDVLFVDGAHRYRPARADIRDFGARVRGDGVMLIHDSFSSIGVTAAIVRLLVPSARWRYEGRSRSLAIYRATGDVIRPRNAARQLAELGWFAKNLALKVALTVGLGGVARRFGRTAPEWPY